MKKLLPLAIMATAMAANLPENGQVTMGEAEFAYQENTLNIEQASEVAIINWDSFNIAEDHVVKTNITFADDVGFTVHNVVGQELSRIAGHIESNGEVVIKNPAGVFLTEGATVDVPGLMLMDDLSVNGGGVRVDAPISVEDLFISGRTIDVNAPVDADSIVIFDADMVALLEAMSSSTPESEEIYFDVIKAFFKNNIDTVNLNATIAANDIMISLGQNGTLNAAELVLTDSGWYDWNYASIDIDAKVANIDKITIATEADAEIIIDADTLNLDVNNIYAPNPEKVSVIYSFEQGTFIVPEQSAMEFIPYSEVMCDACDFDFDFDEPDFQ